MMQIRRHNMPAIERLGTDDLADIIALHHAVRQDMPEGTVAFETDAFFAMHLMECGQIFGCRNNGKLIAYGVLGLPRQGDPNFGEDHHLPTALLSLVAHLDGVAVAPAFRGLGIQKALCMRRIHEASRQGRRIMLSTVSPENTASLANLTECGLSICGEVQKFGGARYLMRRDLT